jgi:enterochelin esterase-like enzyme
MMKINRLIFALWICAAGTLSACANPPPTLSPSPVPVLPTKIAPTPTQTPPACTEDGTIDQDVVPHPTQGYKISFEYYLPPCYQAQPDKSYPVLYLITLSFESRFDDQMNSPISLTNRLIRSGKLPPVIVIVPTDLIGMGTDSAYALDLVPYVDSRFRTLRDRQFRGVGGISHAAAISVRMAFRYPDTFGSVGLLSGGIADNEKDKFKGWIEKTPSQNWPRVRIDLGDQDAIGLLTGNLTSVLNAEHVPYQLNVGHGSHSWTFWFSVMESYLLWFASGWK